MLSRCFYPWDQHSVVLILILVVSAEGGGFCAIQLPSLSDREEKVSHPSRHTWPGFQETWLPQCNKDRRDFAAGVTGRERASVQEKAAE